MTVRWDEENLHDAGVSVARPMTIKFTIRFDENCRKSLQTIFTLIQCATSDGSAYDLTPFLVFRICKKLLTRCFKIVKWQSFMTMRE